MTDMFAMFNDDPLLDEPTAPLTQRASESDSDAEREQRLDDWEASIPLLMASHPNVKLGTLFCVYKLRLDPDVDFRNIQGEARLRDIPLSGRSMHQAKVLLGLEAPRPSAPRRRRQSEAELSEERDEFSFRPESMPSARETSPPTAELVHDDFELLLRAAIDETVEKQTANYRDAIRAALHVIDVALASIDGD